MIWQLLKQLLWQPAHSSNPNTSSTMSRVQPYLCLEKNRQKEEIESQRVTEDIFLFGCMIKFYFSWNFCGEDFHEYLPLMKILNIYDHEWNNSIIHLNNNNLDLTLIRWNAWNKTNFLPLSGMSCCLIQVKKLPLPSVSTVATKFPIMRLLLPFNWGSGWLAYRRTSLNSDTGSTKQHSHVKKNGNTSNCSG